VKRYLSNVDIIIAGILLGVLLFVSYRYLGAQQSQGLVTPGASLLKLPEIEVLTVTREKYDLSNLANHRFILMMVDGNGYSCEQQLEILAGLKMTIDNMNAVVLFASAPDPGVLEKIQDKQITLLVDEEGKIGRMTGISSLPMVLFVSEELNICAMRGPVSTNLISNFSSVVQQFLEGKELTNTAMNLFKPGDVLPIFVTQSKSCNEPLLQEKLAAKHVIIHFSTTCSPCISELCALRKFIDAGNSVSVLGITNFIQSEYCSPS